MLEADMVEKSETKDGEWTRIAPSNDIVDFDRFVKRYWKSLPEHLIKRIGMNLY